MSRSIFELKKDVRIKDGGVFSSSYYISILLLALIYFLANNYILGSFGLQAWGINLFLQMAYLSLLHFYIHFPANINKQFTVRETCFMFYMARVTSDYRISSLWKSVFLAATLQCALFLLRPYMQFLSMINISYLSLCVVSMLQYFNYRSSPFSNPEIMTFKDQFYSNSNGLISCYAPNRIRGFASVLQVKNSEECYAPEFS